MFFNNKVTYNLSKAYFLAKGESSLDLKGLIEEFLKYSEFKAMQFSLNYGAEHDIESLLKSVSKLNIEEFESLDVYDSENRLVLSISKLFSYLELGFSVFGFTAITNFDEELNREIKLFNDLRDVESLIYGYSRFLREDYSLIGEQRVKKGLFGGLSISVVPEDTLWMEHPKDIDNGAFKGFYPLNYLTDKAFDVMKQNTDSLLNSQRRQGNILIIDKPLQQKLLENPRLKKYAHFNET